MSGKLDDEAHGQLRGGCGSHGDGHSRGAKSRSYRREQGQQRNQIEPQIDQPILIADDSDGCIGPQGEQCGPQSDGGPAAIGPTAAGSDRQFEGKADAAQHHEGEDEILGLPSDLAGELHGDGRQRDQGRDDAPSQDAPGVEKLVAGSLVDLVHGLVSLCPKAHDCSEHEVSGMSEK